MGTLYVIPTPVGNLEDITLRALRLLREADLVLAEDTRTSGLLLKHYDIPAHFFAHHKFNEHQTAEILAARIEAGETMCLVSDAGTPAISDPGFLLVRACAERGVEVQCLPGATAFVPALVNSALPADRFCFEGFLPQKKGRQSRLTALQDEERTMIFYESPYRVLKTLEQFAEAFGGDRPAATCREISKLHEETLRGTIEQLIAHFQQHEPRGEFVLLVGGKKLEKKTKNNKEKHQEQ
ncbi:MAG: 16S rRNA (cytidine(1402)-2'-O)-methyltransferase [Alloprevotella sp.]|nr:16S rRNA (cytidine(1402)-2'-O)-methyltransferase [Alloprevotella sp.]